MTDNLAIWNALEQTDPKHVKEITGKSYKGNSPRPHWVIWKLTEKFGPVGKGFGWDVQESAYIDGVPHQDGTEKLHECRIRFWWWDGNAEGSLNSVDSYGATKALYKSRQGQWISDEDAAKKSLTDAITKAASWLGVAGDIFMGRWDDSKYVAELQAEARRPTPARIPIDGQRQAFRDSLDHDPETGEVHADHDDMAEGDDPPSVKDFMAVIREMAGPGATREQLEARYAAEVIANIGKRKSNEKARRWFTIFCDLHESAIGRIQDQNLRSQVRSAIALKQAQINGEKVDAADFGYPFGEPIVMGEVRVG